MNKLIPILAALLLFLFACGNTSDPEPIHVELPDTAIECITVVMPLGPPGEAYYRVYTSPEPIAAISEHLTSLSLQQLRTEPDLPPGTFHYTLTLYFEDSTTKQFLHGSYFVMSDVWYTFASYEPRLDLSTILSNYPSCN